MRIRREIAEGRRIPRGYGIAWHDLEYERAVCYPLVLNRLIGWLHRLRWEWARPPRGVPRIRAEIEAADNALRVLLGSIDDRPDLLRIRLEAAWARELLSRVLAKFDPPVTAR